MGKHILIVDDDALLRRSLAFNLEKAGYTASTAATAEDALKIIQNSRPTLVLLDIGLPGMDGLDAVKQIKDRYNLPVIFLTARRRELDEVLGLELGADDYVTKPFSPRELVLRVKAILRRKEVPAEGEKMIRIGDLLIEIDRHRVSVKNNPVQLTSTEFKLLVELASNRGRVQTRERLLDKVWGYTYEGYARTVDTHIRRLREKLGPLGDFIETMRGVGYRFREEKE
jgi:two-component system phosphate regulon response regulator PhoB